MLALKLSRVGKKKQPSYRIIVVEKSKDPWGTSRDIVGFYNPRTEPKTVKINEERVKYWIEHGAQPTNTVWNILVDAKIVQGEKRKSHRNAEKPAEAKKEAAPAASKA